MDTYRGDVRFGVSHLQSIKWTIMGWGSRGVGYSPHSFPNELTPDWPPPDLGGKMVIG